MARENDEIQEAINYVAGGKKVADRLSNLLVEDKQLYTLSELKKISRAYGLLMKYHSELSSLFPAVAPREGPKREKIIRVAELAQLAINSYYKTVPEKARTALVSGEIRELELMVQENLPKPV